MIESDDKWIVAEPETKYWSEVDFPLKDETRKIIGTCMEIHRILGKGFAEIVYKDALALECRTKMFPYEREKKYELSYKGIVLPHSFNADFVIFKNIIVEVKNRKQELQMKTMPSL